MSDDPPIASISADRPITSISGDRLGRGSFARSLAEALVRWQGEDSLVVAVYGPWGSGKSSLKNMILELVRQQQDRPAIVEFNPWAWSGRDRLFSAFFEEMGLAIGKHSGVKDAKALASGWRKYGARLSLAGTAMAAIKTGTQAIGVPLIPLILEGMASGAKQTSQLAEGAAKAHEVASEDEPLEDLKRSLAESLAELGAPLLVVMDDVDRLSNEEVHLLFQLIKANADFPKVVYFMLFDRAVIEKALEGRAGSSGRDYMEKIIQAGFDVPKHDQADLDNLLCSGLDRLMSFEGANRTFDLDRWGNLLHLGLHPILNTPRDVNRFLSSLSFSVGLFFREQVLEVNVIDLIGIEILRIFEPRLYHQLPGRQGMLLGNEISHRSGLEERQRRKQTVEEFIDQASEPHRPGVRAILKELFPSVDWLLADYGEGSGFEASWMRELRICHADFFDRYFALSVPNGDLPVSLIDRLISVLNDENEIRRELTILREGNQLVEALKRLAAYTSELNMNGASPFITALMDVGDTLPDRGAGMFGVGPDMTAYFLIYDFLKREESPGTRSRILLEVLSATKGLYLPVQVVSLDEQRRKKRDAFNPPLLDGASSAKAGKICLAKIQEAAADGRLLGSKLENYLWRWSELAGEAAPRKFVASLTSTLEGTLQFLRSFVVEVRSQSAGRVNVQVKSRIDLKAIEPFVALARIKSNLGALVGGEVPNELRTIAAEYQRELDVYKDALHRVQSGDFDAHHHVDNVVRIDLNSASLDELVALPGIDKELASRIVAGRPFDNLDAMMSVRGIGKKRFSQLRDLLKT